MADLIAAGDQLGWTDLIRATTPEMCGHDIEVPDWKFHFTPSSSSLNFPLGLTVGAVSGGHAANMFTPGALISGCTTTFTTSFITLKFGLHGLIKSYPITSLTSYLENVR